MGKVEAELAEKLAPYKVVDAGHLIAATMMDADIRVAGAWQTVAKSWVRPDEPEPEDEADRLTWLWSGVAYDATGMEAASGLPSYVVEARMDALVSMRMIWPDGTVSTWLQRLATARLKERLEGGAGA